MSGALAGTDPALQGSFAGTCAKQARLCCFYNYDAGLCGARGALQRAAHPDARRGVIDGWIPAGRTDQFCASSANLRGFRAVCSGWVHRSTPESGDGSSGGAARRGRGRGRPRAPPRAAARAGAGSTAARWQRPLRRSATRCGEGASAAGAGAEGGGVTVLGAESNLGQLTCTALRDFGESRAGARGSRLIRTRGPPPSAAACARACACGSALLPARAQRCQLSPRCE